LILKTALASIKNGYEYSDMGWVLESNTGMIKTIERIGAKLSKRYTIFEKPIAASQSLPLPESLRRSLDEMLDPSEVA
jgi:hypothetical protein